MIISVLVLCGLGMYLWGYRSGISKAADDLQELAKEMQDAKKNTEEENEYE